ncbi:MAG: hypothetical protein ABMA26_10150 [Limisphaerales bacterium]
MRTTLLKSLALLAVALVCAPPAFAQVKSEPVPAKPAVPVPPVPPKPPSAPARVFRPDATAVAAALAARKLEVLKIPDSELAVAVEILQRALEANGMDELNILFGPDTKQLEVSAMNLRNVTGPDALQLLAASASCSLEPMLGTDVQPAANVGGGLIMPASRGVIAYMFRGKPKPASHGIVYMGGPQPMPAGRAVPASSPTGRLTRIYPLGAVSTATKFPDLEKTLRDIFKADNVAENQVSLALHEKTNVLVVNSAEPVHALVEQLLVALKDNTSQADRQNSARDRAMGREELESAVRAQKRLAEELAERDALLRELQKELRKLQDASQKSPSAK